MNRYVFGAFLERQLKHFEKADSAYAKGVRAALK